MSDLLSSSSSPSSLLSLPSQIEIKSNTSIIWVLTLFPEFFDAFLKYGVISRFLQQKNSPIEIKIIQIRNWAHNSYGSVDDYPFGGGAGLIMRFDVLSRALIEGVFVAGNYDLSSIFPSKIPEDEKNIFNLQSTSNSLLEEENKMQKEKLPLVIYTSPKGETFNSNCAKSLAKVLQGLEEPKKLERLEDKKRDIVFVAGRYEGVDERFIEMFVDREISIGDYVLSGGEIAILSMLDSVIRQIPGVLGNSGSIEEESFENNLLEAPQYTRPRKFLGKEVPEIYLSGNHAEIKKYRRNEAEKITQKLRPDIYDQYRNAKKE
ncbi:MAG: tRNA (guanosine(37)-N1)-methyltransferase TrmD [Oligoflexia bacterium]|nr:tRNA (guanosine(37)-N1)-methyltransferase TrmD [Oligoflexia bacterium]